MEIAQIIQKAVEALLSRCLQIKLWGGKQLEVQMIPNETTYPHSFKEAFDSKKFGSKIPFRKDPELKKDLPWKYRNEIAALFSSRIKQFWR